MKNIIIIIGLLVLVMFIGFYVNRKLFTHQVAPEVIFHSELLVTVKAN